MDTLDLKIIKKEESSISIAPSIVSMFGISYETTTCRGNLKRWDAVILADSKDDALKSFYEYMETKKHITSCNVISVNFKKLVQLDFGSCVMSAVSSEQLFSFRGESRKFVSCMLPKTEEWFIPSVLNLYKTDFTYLTKFCNCKSKSIYVAGFNDLEACDSTAMFIDEYKTRHNTHVFKEKILNTRWVGEVKLIL